MAAGGVLAVSLPASMGCLIAAVKGDGSEAPRPCVAEEDPQIMVINCYEIRAGSGKVLASQVWRVILVQFLLGIVLWVTMLESQANGGAWSGGSLGALVALGCVLVMGVLLVFCMASGGMLTDAYIYRVVIPLVYGGIMLLMAVSGASALGAVMISVGYTCLDLFCFSMIAGACSRCGADSGRAFGICRAIECSAPVAALALISASQVLFAIDDAMLILVVSILGAAAVVIAFTVGERGVFSGSRTASGSAFPKAEASVFAQQCEDAIKVFKLSPREAEVMSLLVRGRSVPHIANRLGISRTTVKTHITRIYQKMEAIDRQDMIDIIENLPTKENNNPPA